MPAAPSVERTFEFLTRLWADFADIFPYEFSHTGGDEVETDCWDDDATSKAWMKKEGLNSTDTYIYFVNRNINISKSLGRRPIIWDDSWKDYGTVIDKGSTIMFWTSNSVNGERSMQKAADDGYDFIAASAESVFVRDCSDCVFTLAAKQLRTRDCKNCKVFLYTQTEPIIEIGRAHV